MKSWLCIAHPAPKTHAPPACLTALLTLKRRTQVSFPRTPESDDKPSKFCLSPTITRFKRLTTTLLGVALVIVLAGCASKPTRYVDPFQAESDANVKFATVFGAVAWTDSPTQPLRRASILEIMAETCAAHGLKVNPLEEYMSGTTTISRYECNP